MSPNPHPLKIAEIPVHLRPYFDLMVEKSSSPKVRENLERELRGSIKPSLINEAECVWLLSNKCGCSLEQYEVNGSGTGTHPDFLMKTGTGNVICVEATGRESDNPNSIRKIIYDKMQQIKNNTQCNDAPCLIFLGNQTEKRLDTRILHIEWLKASKHVNLLGMIYWHRGNESSFQLWENSKAKMNPKDALGDRLPPTGPF